jgi:hypothetical protein
VGLLLAGFIQPSKRVLFVAKNGVQVGR